MGLHRGSKRFKGFRVLRYLTLTCGCTTCKLWRVHAEFVVSFLRGACIWGVGKHEYEYPPKDTIYVHIYIYIYGWLSKLWSLFGSLL